MKKATSIIIAISLCFSFANLSNAQEQKVKSTKKQTEFEVSNFKKLTPPPKGEWTVTEGQLVQDEDQKKVEKYNTWSVVAELKPLDNKTYNFTKKWKYNINKEDKKFTLNTSLTCLTGSIELIIKDPKGKEYKSQKADESGTIRWTHSISNLSANEGYSGEWTIELIVKDVKYGRYDLSFSSF